MRFVAGIEGMAHIRLSFEPKVHGDGNAFDGPGGTTAHAYYPQFGGDVHFDDDEQWVINNTDSKSSTTYSITYKQFYSLFVLIMKYIVIFDIVGNKLDLFQVALHEIGHSLGLDHSDKRDSVMAPIYKTPKQDFSFQMPADDIEAIQAMYGE